MPKKKKKEEKIEFSNQKERRTFLKKTLNEINRKLDGNFIHFGDTEQKWEKQPTGVEEVDKFIGGGIARGRCTVLWGGSGTGKSTLCYHLVAKAQSEGKIVAYLDLENSFDKDRAKLFGVNLEDLVLAHFPVAEQSLDTIIKLAKNKLVDVIILDSIHSLCPVGEQKDKKGDKSVESDTMALLARKLAQFFRMASNYIYQSNIALLLIGQTRTNLGGFIALQTLSGGNSLKHNAVLIVNMRRGQKADAPKSTYKDENGKTKHNIIGFDCVFKIDKTQVSETAPEYREKHINFYFDTGFNKRKKEEKKDE